MQGKRQERPKQYNNLHKQTKCTLIGKQMLFEWLNLSSVWGGNSGLLVTSQLRCYLVSWEADALPLVLSRILWRSQRCTSSHLTLQSSEPSQKSCCWEKSRKKVLQKQKPNSDKYDSFQGDATPSTLSFWALFNEDLPPVHVAAATDQSPPVAQELLATEKY